MRVWGWTWDRHRDRRMDTGDRDRRGDTVVKVRTHTGTDRRMGSGDTGGHGGQMDGEREDRETWEGTDG